MSSRHVDHTCWAKINLSKLSKKLNVCKHLQCYCGFLYNQWMKGAIQLKMIGWKLIQNNNIICIFSRKLNYFSSTRTIKLYELVYLLSYELSITTLSLSLVRTHPNQWRIQDFPEVGGANIQFCQILPKAARNWKNMATKGETRVQKFTM